jgi:hypothetical protein
LGYQTHFSSRSAGLLKTYVFFNILNLYKNILYQQVAHSLIDPVSNWFNRLNRSPEGSEMIHLPKSAVLKLLSAENERPIRVNLTTDVEYGIDDVNEKPFSCEALISAISRRMTRQDLREKISTDNLCKET